MMKRLILLFVFLFISPLNVKAVVCENNTEVKYQQLAKNISSSYDYKEENNKIVFSITFTNINENLYLKNLDTNQVYNYTGSEMTIGNIESGKSYKFGVYTKQEDCSLIKLYTHYINIPFYNSFYKNELCKGIEDYKYCNKWFNKKVTYEEFQKNVLNYKDSLKKDDSNIKKNESSNIYSILLNFYINYYYIILPIIIASILIGIRMYNKKNDLF